MNTGFDIRFDPRDGDPLATAVQYVGGADTALDMLEGARALLHRAATFVNTDDGYQYEQDACLLAYQIASGAADMVASSEPANDGFRETYAGWVLTHVMELLRENPTPAWHGGQS